jgi:signal transduction histidine kinase
VEVALYRIVQESLTNAARHGHADQIGVLLLKREGRVQAIIEDNGRGFDPEEARRAERSVGIHGMAERAELLGGQLNIESNDEGTTVYVEIPL